MVGYGWDYEEIAAFRKGLQVGVARSLAGVDHRVLKVAGKLHR